ncbi:MAG TPA: N-acetyl-gamma-glutamyl-phosphate reductase [Candidatus Limnocylindrales bacterium]|nr:N-acetyl-gamma-glutamyl-phosphate reductase [Candidatus Limnocylindrales bacterium]
MHGTLTHPTKSPEPTFAAEVRFAPPAPAAPTRVPAADSSLRAAGPQNASAVPVAIVGATGYAGGEAVRLLARHPGVRIVGIVGRDGHGEPLAERQIHLAGAGLRIESEIPSDAAAVFLALPHSAAAAIVPSIAERGTAVVDLGPDFRLHDPADYPIWYGFAHPRPDLLSRAVYGLPELHRAELAAAGPSALVGAPGCYPTAAILATAPLARAGLIADLVVDAKSGVSGAGRDPKPDLTFSEVNESVKAYGVGGHRHVAEMEQELRGLSGADLAPVEFVPHLVPMTRGILATCHVRTTRPVEQAELDDLYAAAYDGEPFVRVVDAPPATKHVLGSNDCRVHVRALPRTGRVVAIAAIDNLVKGAAGQAVQAFNVAFGLPETAGLTALPVAP